MYMYVRKGATLYTGGKAFLRETVNILKHGLRFWSLLHLLLLHSCTIADVKLL